MLDSILIPYFQSVWPLVLEYHLVVLFLISFAAATILPLGSEWLFIALVAANQSAAGLLLVATVGNTLGGITLWFMGRGMTSWYVRRTAGREARGLRRAEQWFQHYGVWSLLLSWVPIVGDPLCLVAGSLRIRLSLFCILVATGKGMRYLSVWYLTQYVASS